jgi:hypothetical protein
LSPERLLLIGGVAPERALASRDMQGIFESLALNREQGILKPNFAPSEPLVEVPAECGGAIGA